MKHTADFIADNEKHPYPAFIMERVMSAILRDYENIQPDSDVPFIPTRALKLIRDGFAAANRDWDEGKRV